MNDQQIRDRLTKLAKMLNTHIVIEQYKTPLYKYRCHLERVEVKDNSISYCIYGHGSTEKKAMEDYIDQISGHSLVCNAMSSHRKEVFVI